MSRRRARRRRQDAGVAGVLVLSQVVAWLVADGWWWRLGALVVALLALPVLVTLVFDRRSTR